MTAIIGVLAAVAALAGGVVIGMFGAMGALFGAVLLIASAIITLFLPFL